MIEDRTDIAIKDLARQVMENCHRSDARFAGSFSLCGLLLRLRDYYRWEHGLDPWREVDPASVLGWIEEREEMWETLLGRDVEPLRWRGRRVDPFDSEAVNRGLADDGWYYGSGLAAFMKPSFFLGRVVGEKHLGGFRVIYLGDELARDLFSAPAQTRGREILARRRPTAVYIWETILHAGASRRRAMDVALDAYGMTRSDLEEPYETWASRMENLLEGEMEAFVRHEYGEATDTAFPRDEWRSIVGGHPHSRIELLARTIKDLLADTADFGRLGFIVNERRTASLAVYIGLLDGLAATLFPEIGPAFERFVADGDWEAVESARVAARSRLEGMAAELRNLAARAEGRPEWLTERVEETFYRPLEL